MQRVSRPGCGSRRAVLVALGAVLWLPGGWAAAQVPPPRDWSPPVHAALEAYYDGRYRDAQGMCQHVLNTPGGELERRDAALLQALCLLRMPARADCLDGRGRLAQLAREDPTLQDDPECNLAYGMAQAALKETADALDAIDRAVAAFAAQGRVDQQREALVALARVWIQHTEWEATPARFRIQRPLTRAAADAVRRAQVAQLRAQVASLPASAAALAEMDLAWARYKLENASSVEQGRALLEQLVASAGSTPAGSEAALLLAETYEAAGRVSEALELYERVQAEARGEARRRALARAEEIRQPRIRLEAPATAREGQGVTLALCVRGIPAVQVEVRQVNLTAWLATPATRGNEALLPESGSLRAAWDLKTAPPVNGSWWSSADLDRPLSVRAPVGSYVIVVRGHDANGRQYTHKQLFLVSNLSAVCAVGREHVVVWAVDAAPLAEAPGGEFWMRRSFAPTRLTFDGGIARFRLPGEARVMREKDWYCLVRCGAHLALCRGRLQADSSEANEGRSVVMIGGPQTPLVGQALYVSGLLPASRAAGVGTAPDVPLELRVFDALDRLVSDHSVALSAGGVFSAEIPIGPELAGKSLRVIPRRGGQVLENAAGRLVLRVPAADAKRLCVRCDVPAWFTEPTPLVCGTVTVEYPWGTSPAGVRGRVRIDALQLPTTASNSEPLAGDTIYRDGWVDARGQYPFVFSVSPAEFRLSAPPLAIQVAARVRSREGWQGQAAAQVLLATQRPHAWLMHQPGKPHVGEKVRFSLGWFEPDGLAVAELGEVEVCHDGNPVARLRLEPGWRGLQSEAWQPPEPGAYHVTTTVPVVDGEPIRLEKTLDVLEGTPADAVPAASGLRCRAHFVQRDDQRGVRVVLAGEVAGPVAVVAEAGDPLSALALDDAVDRRELFLPLPAQPPTGTRVLVIGNAATGPVVHATTTVAPDPAEGLSIRVAAAASEVWPGALVPVTCTTGEGQAPPPGTTLVVRLIDALDTGFASRRPEPSREAVAAGGVGLVSSDRAPAAPASPAPGSGYQRRGIDLPALERVLHEGDTLWSQWVDFDSPRRDVTVPIPADPGLYRLLAAAIAPDGTVATQAVVLDARRGVRVWLDVPQRVTVGDRTLVAVRVENGGREALAVRLRLDVGDGLKIESLRKRGPEGRSEACEVGPLTLQLPGGGRVWVLAEVEAARPGPGQAAVEVAAAGSQRLAGQPYEVLAAAEGEQSDGALRVTRTVTVWRRSQPDANLPAASDAEAGAAGDASRDQGPLLRGDEFKEWLARQRDPQRRRWSESAWSPTDRLTPGQYVKVREEFTLKQWQPGALWTQRVPVTCFGVQHGGSDLQTVGVLTPGRGDELCFRMEPMGPGGYVHEYFLAVVRPGTCVLPPPELEVAGQPVPLVASPGEIRLTVVGRE